MPKVSVIIPTMPGREAMLTKLLTTIPSIYEVVVVDDMDILLAAKRNKGAMKSGGEYLLFIDDDNYLGLSAIENALAIAEEPSVGVVGFMATYHDRQQFVADGGSMRNHLTGFTTGVNTNAYFPNISHEPYEVDEIANCFMIHSELFFELGGFDEKNFPMDMNESDLCKRIKDKGLKVMMAPMARCYHKSVTYSCFPTFRKEMYAYYHGNGRINFSRKSYPGLRYWCHLGIFLPLFISFYTASLIWQRNWKVILPFWRGIAHGLQGRLENPYQQEKMQKDWSFSI